MTIHVLVSELPDLIQSSLKQIGYHRKDIPVEIAETVSPLVSGGAGYRGFFLAVNLSTGQKEARIGSWGGANMFNPENRVDLDGNEYKIPRDIVVLKGSQGEKVFCTLYLSPTNVLPCLPAKAEVSDREAKILAIYRSYIPAARRDYLGKMMVKGAEIDSLVERAFLKRNKAGAVQITTEGKNACAGVRVY